MPEETTILPTRTPSPLGVTPSFFDILKATVLLSLIFLCVSLGLLTYRLDRTLIAFNTLVVQTTATSQEAGKLMASSKDIIISEQRYLQHDLPATMGKLNTGLDNLNNVMLATKATADNLNETVILTRSDTHGLIAQLAQDSHQMAVETTAAVQTTNTTVRSLQPLTGAATDSVVQITKATQDLDNLIQDPNVKRTLDNVTNTTGSVSSMAADTAGYWHGLLHPTWPRRIYNAVTGVGIDAAKVFVP